jgi:acyl-CoA thioesterase YciA
MPDPTEDRFLAIKVRMMPRETNPQGTIFGGVLLSYIDQAGAVGAAHEIRRAGWPEHMLVTVGMDRVDFHQSVYVGDVVSFWTRLVRVGRTSMTMQVTVETDRDGRAVTVTEAQITFVAVKLTDGERRPIPIKGE